MRSFAVSAYWAGRTVLVSAALVVLVAVFGIAVVKSSGLIGAGHSDLKSGEMTRTTTRSSVLYEDDWLKDLRSGRVFKRSRSSWSRSDYDDERSHLGRDPEASGRPQPVTRTSSETYRTVCVRLCDGYFFPISTATTSEHFGRDEQACSSQCNSPSKLFVYKTAGGSPETMADADGSPYAGLQNAFLYKTKYSKSCQCRAQPWTQEARAQHKLYATVGWQKKAHKVARQERRKARKQRRAVAALRTKLKRDYGAGRVIEPGSSAVSVVVGSTHTSQSASVEVSEAPPKGRGSSSHIRPQRMGLGARVQSRPRAQRQPVARRSARRSNRGWRMKILRPDS